MKDRHEGDGTRLYVGLDVSKERTQVCVVAACGRVMFEGKTATDPDALARLLARQAPGAERIGLEMGAMASWLWHGLRAHGLPAVCIDARHAHAALSTRINKSDRGDARGLAELMRTGWFREVRARSSGSQALRALLAARAQLIRMRADLQGQLRGLLKERGIRMPRAIGAMYRRRVREAAGDRIAPDDPMATIVVTFLSLHERLCDEQRAMDERIKAAAARDEATRRLMTVPGVGFVTASCFRQTIDDAGRFARSATVGAYLGLTPRRWQSGEVDRTGRVSKRGSIVMRALLYEAANVVMHRLRRPCSLQAWATALAARIGLRRAKVALARKLAVVMHAIWVDGTEFDWAAGRSNPVASA